MTRHRRKQGYSKENIVKILLVIIVVWFVVTLVNNQILAGMVQTENVEITVLEHTETGYGLLHGTESLVIAQADGKVEPLVKEGERVRKGNAVVKIGETYSYTNYAGLVSYSLDGLEESSDLSEICSTDLKKRYEKQTGQNNEEEKDSKAETSDSKKENGKKNKEKQKQALPEGVNGQAVAKVVNTFDEIYLYVTVPRGEYTESLVVNQQIEVHLMDLDQRVKGTVKEILDTKNGNRHMKLKLDTVKETVFQQRIYLVELPYEKQTTIAVPKKSLVTKKGETGVYYLQKGFVFWQPVTVGATWDEYERVVIESGLKEGDIIVTTPHLVHEGENIKY